MLLCAALPSRAEESFTRDVACETAPAVLRNSRFGLELGAVDLRDGRGCVRSSTGSQACEWSIELTRAEWWGTRPRFLVVVIRANHESGSGAWESMFVGNCQGGHVAPVFSGRYLYGATIEI